MDWRLHPKISGIAVSPPNMLAEEALYAFLFRLTPHTQEHVGAHVQGDLEVVMAMAQCLEVYRGGDGAKASGEKKGSGELKKQNKKGTVAIVQGNEAEETVQVIQSQRKT